MKLERVLVTLDGSKDSEGALSAARRLLRGRPGRVTLLQVGPRVRPETSRQDLDRMELIATQIEEEAGKQEDLQVQFMRRDGSDAAAVILEEVERNQPDVVAMATHGRSGLSRLVVGSTTEAVLRGTSAPVLVCNPHASRCGAREPFGRILVPLDGSDTAPLCLPLVIELAKAHDAEVLLLRVEPEELEEGSARCEEVRGYLSHYADALERGGVSKVELLGLSGRPADVILEVVDGRRVDLIAMGTHGRTGLERLLVGSVAEEVLRRSPCPVILRRPPQAKGVSE